HPVAADPRARAPRSGRRHRGGRRGAGRDPDPRSGHGRARPGPGRAPDRPRELSGIHLGGCRPRPLHPVSDDASPRAERIRRRGGARPRRASSPSSTAALRAPMSAEERVAYDFAVLRAVPHVYLGAFVAVGVVVHARTAGFLGMRALTDARELAARVPDVDHELLARYLRSCCAVAGGDPAAGPVALAPPSERFHWLTAPRSD